MRADDDMMFEPLVPDAEAMKAGAEPLDFNFGKVEAVEEAWQTPVQEPEPLVLAQLDEETVLEFVPEADYVQEVDGELKPIIDDVKEKALRQQVEKEIFTNVLSEREKQVLYLVRMYQMEKRYSPTCGKVARLLGVSRARAKQLVLNIVKKGYLEWSDHKSWVHKLILFPKGITFPWQDKDQFPDDIF